MTSEQLLPWAQLPIAGIFFWLYLRESKKREAAETKLNNFLEKSSDKLIEYNKEQSTTINDLTSQIKAALAALAASARGGS